MLMLPYLLEWKMSFSSLVGKGKKACHLKNHIQGNIIIYTVYHYTATKSSTCSAMETNYAVA